MRRHAWCAAVVIAGLACSGNAGAESEEETLSELRAIKQAIVDGHRARDRVSLDSLYPDDYSASDPRGAVRTKTELLANLATGPEMIDGQYTLGYVRRWGDVAVASGHGRMTYRSGDSTWVSEYNSVNVFERRDGRWRYAAAYLP